MRTHYGRKSDGLRRSAKAANHDRRDANGFCFLEGEAFLAKKVKMAPLGQDTKRHQAREAMYAQDPEHFGGMELKNGDC